MTTQTSNTLPPGAQAHVLAFIAVAVVTVGGMMTLDLLYGLPLWQRLSIGIPMYAHGAYVMRRFSSSGEIKFTRAHARQILALAAVILAASSAAVWGFIVTLITLPMVIETTLADPEISRALPGVFAASGIITTVALFVVILRLWPGYGGDPE